MVALGVNAPACAVRATPTCGVPVTAGGTVLRNVPGATALVGAEDATASAYPRWRTFTWSEICLRRTSGVGVYAEPVAPTIGTPSASHCSAQRAARGSHCGATRPAGSHTRADAVSGWSTCGTPAIDGGVRTSKAPGLTALVGAGGIRRIRQPAARATPF